MAEYAELLGLGEPVEQGAGLDRDQVCLILLGVEYNDVEGQRLPVVIFGLVGQEVNASIAGELHIVHGDAHACLRPEEGL